jgi:hypothetical protein
MKSLGVYNMFNEIFPTIVMCFVFLGVVIFFVLLGVQITKSNKLHKNDPPEKNIKTDLNYEFTTTETNATVVDMMCNARVIGQKSVKSIEEFFVCFRTENNDIIKLKVLKEMYDGFEIGQTGKLQLVDGELFGFEIF